MFEQQRDKTVPSDGGVLTLQEAASYLKLSEVTILRLANKGFIPGAKIGRQWRFSRETIRGLVKHPEIMRRLDLRR